MRSIPFYPMLVVLLVGLGGYLGCDPNTVGPILESTIEKTASTSIQYPASIPDRTANTVLVGSFNMKRFGPSKLGDPWVMEKFAAIITKFDIIALQEITSVDQRTLGTLVDQINRSGLRYSYTISPRIGRESTGYFEQYAFVFDTTRIAGGPEFCYTVQDGEDVLHREPFVGRFQTLMPNRPFQFSLINIHTDPGEIAQELNVLATVYKNVRQFEYPEDDVLLLGDLNADPSKFQMLGQIPGFEPVIVGIPTNTRNNRTIDNILIDRQSTREFTGRAGTINMEQMFGLTLKDVERISDHLPIWAEFSAAEIGVDDVPAAFAGGDRKVYR